MTWRVISASEVGTSHIEHSRDCEDSCWAVVDTAQNGADVLSMIVADGAGSALRGGEGAELAIQSAAAFLAEELRKPDVVLDDELATNCVIAVRELLYATAEREGLRARDYACTFLALISTSTAAIAFQIGDGGIVLDVGAGLELALVPMAGEYANMTHFVTDEDAISVLSVRRFESAAHRAAVFSDGIQRLALNMADNTPYEPFFTRFFKVMSEARNEQEETLHRALVNFLTSPAVNERTDDDKTLALAVKLS